MLLTLWSVKGGSGVSVTAAVLAAALARRARRAVVVDLAGDQPAVLGLPEVAGPGLCDWLASVDGAPDALGRLLVEAAPGLWLLPRGHATDWSAQRPASLVAALGALRCPVVVDAGTVAVSDAGAGRGVPAAGARPAVGLGPALAEAGRSFVVIQPCYLALRRYAVARDRGLLPWPPDGVVVVGERDRALSAQDVASTMTLPLVASVDLDAEVAGAVDAGTLVRRRHRGLERSLRRVA